MKTIGYLNKTSKKRKKKIIKEIYNLLQDCRGANVKEISLLYQT